MQFFQDFVKAFIPLFVAMDVFAVLPLFISMTKGVRDPVRKKLVTEAVFGALVLAMIFLVAGQILFGFLGITPDDFKIGGGIVLLILAITDILFTGPQEERRSGGGNGLGIVPIGIPLIVGPAALTTILICVESFGYLVTLAALLVNLFIVWTVFRQSRLVIRAMGEAGTNAFGKVASLFLAGIAVMMIRTGVVSIIEKSGG